MLKVVGPEEKFDAVILMALLRIDDFFITLFLSIMELPILRDFPVIIFSFTPFYIAIWLNILRLSNSLRLILSILLAFTVLVIS